jgi:diguanylate cyclase (GGDEF)-like protein
VITAVSRVVSEGTGFSSVVIDEYRDDSGASGSLLQPQFRHHDVYFIPASNGGAGGDEWRSDDALLAPIEGPGGRRYGVISVGDPVSGRRPDDWQLEVLSVLAAHAAVAIESARQLERHRGVEELTHLAYHDALTGLPNRILAEEQTELALARARRSNDEVALMFVDLDGFKEVNDQLGHAAGDQLLAGVAARLRTVLRDSDLLARQGGDEFLVLLADLPSDAELAVENVGGKLLDALREPFDILGRKLRTGASIGISLYPTDADDTDTLLRHADAAMYSAKAAGGRRLAFHVRSDAILSRRASLSAQLRQAMAGAELQLHYQPVWSLSDRRVIVGVEALLRWQHPDHGLLRPDAFINTAEQSVAGDELVSWVLREACRQGREWSDRGLSPLIGINVSHQQLLAPGYVDLFVDHVHGAGLDPGRFMIELTESAWTVDAADTLAVLRSLRSHGTVAALDDFGAGYTSLSRLRHLACDVIKVDRSLMAGVPTDPTATTVATAVLELAGACRAQVIAEGVENEEQAALLGSLGVTQAQGFLFGHALPGARMTTLLARYGARR